ncbi:hypothetical protein AB0M43_17675 [Longispora sp. NPDC051575]
MPTRKMIIEEQLPGYDVVRTEQLVVDAARRRRSGRCGNWTS